MPAGLAGGLWKVREVFKGKQKEQIDLKNKIGANRFKATCEGAHNPEMKDILPCIVSS